MRRKARVRGEVGEKPERRNMKVDVSEQEEEEKGEGKKGV